MKYLRLLLWPFSLLYGLVVVIRNWCYDAGWLKSTAFNLPVIAVGNLDVGGAGKSPMTEYLIRLLKNDYNTSVLSRGYGRKTKGYVLANAQSTAAQIGDEPAQFKHKFMDVTVAVCEDRAVGIDLLQKDHDLILLDDAYQHRAVKPGLSILLFDYNKLNDPHLLLPAGNLREPFSGKMRADIFVVSKCLAGLSEQAQQQIINYLRPYPYQQVFFTATNYLNLRHIDGGKSEINLNSETLVFLLTGIAGTKPLITRLKTITSKIIHYKYPDHHQFSLKNIAKLAADFTASSSPNKVVITTEKDAERLKTTELLPHLSKLDILVLPICIEFLGNGKQLFDKTIFNYVRKYSTNNSLH